MIILFVLIQFYNIIIWYMPKGRGRSLPRKTSKKLTTRRAKSAGNKPRNTRRIIARPLAHAMPLTVAVPSVSENNQYNHNGTYARGHVVTPRGTVQANYIRVGTPSPQYLPRYPSPNQQHIVDAHIAALPGGQAQFVAGLQAQEHNNYNAELDEFLGQAPPPTPLRRTQSNLTHQVRRQHFTPPLPEPHWRTNHFRHLH
jgi:hypothetical protein